MAARSLNTSDLDTVQTTIHTDLQLTAAASHDEQSVSRITHLALKSLAPTAEDLCELPSTPMLAIVSIAQLLLHSDNATLTLRRLKVWRSGSIHDLFGTPDDILINPEIATAFSGLGPFGTTLVAELRTASAAVHGQPAI